MSSEMSQLSVERVETTEPHTLSGKTCVVTGASRGIGRAIAMELARNGADVVVNYRTSETEAESLIAEIESTEGHGVTVRADVTDRDAVSQMVEDVHHAYGSVDVLVNNAGITIDRRFDQMSHDDWQRVIDVNLGGVFNCTKAFYDDIKNADDGRVINISSVVGQRGNYGQANYAASKSALFGFTRSIALELARHESTANCVAPGYTSTEMVELVRDDIKQRIRGQIPLGRFAKAEEIASVVRFLASSESAYLTGQTINVNGGLYG